MLNERLVAGIYCRLSRDDENLSESMSIANQRQILTDYIREKGWQFTGEYIDDGYTGTNFDRPDFKRMLNDIERGCINCVVTKDLSRLGRNYAMTGFYTEQYFPDHNVRYIAINDGVDTMEEFNDMAGFHNVMNEFYPRDISRKVRQVKKSNAQKGMFMGSKAPYGYSKSPLDKHDLIIDVNVANIVSRIFSSATFGDNSRQIAQQLNAENIPSPSVYYFESNNKENTNKNKSTNWGSATIMAILRNAVYKGDMVQGKRKVVSFKLKKRIVTTPDDWIIVKNTHEPIISPDNWDKVQQILDKKKHYHAPKNNSREISTFAGLCKCADCGSSMAASPRGAKGKEKITYRCTTYVNKGKNSCFSHNVREEILTEIVLRDIHDFAVLAKNNKKNFINQIIKYISESTASKNANAEKQLSEVTDKINSLNTTVRTLYSDRVSGKMPESFFFSLLNDYKKELDELEVKIPALNEQVQSVFNKESDIGQWVENVLKYISIQHMNRMIALELIDKITVSDIHTDNKKREQDIIVYYKTVGDISALIKHNN